MQRPRPRPLIPHGDALVSLIAAASIVAKVTRDRLMADLAARYPAYGFDRHKGCGTADHRAALRRLGPSPIPRVTFSPVRAVVDPRDRMAQLALPGIGPQDIPSPGGAPALPPRACGVGSEGEIP